MVLFNRSFLKFSLAEKAEFIRIKGGLTEAPFFDAASNMTIGAIFVCIVPC